MIQISDAAVTIQTLKQEWPPGGIQLHIARRMAESQSVYVYPSLARLEFEIKLRSHIVAAARKLYESGANFAILKDSRCNPRYWMLTDQGGFQLKENTEPADAIDDIFRNGSRYAFECATAIVIIYYKAVLDSIGRQNFNQLFPSVFLFDGIYDKKLGIRWNKEGEYLPGDVQYFKNPEYNPKNPEWQGENVVLIEHDVYFAHGIGMETKKQIISYLNKVRKPGATISAYLLDEAARPDFAYLSQYNQQNTEPSIGRITVGAPFTIAQIGTTVYIS